MIRTIMMLLTFEYYILGYPSFNFVEMIQYWMMLTLTRMLTCLILLWYIQCNSVDSDKIKTKMKACYQFHWQLPKFKSYAANCRSH